MCGLRAGGWKPRSGWACAGCPMNVLSPLVEPKFGNVGSAIGFGSVTPEAGNGTWVGELAAPRGRAVMVTADERREQCRAHGGCAFHESLVRGARGEHLSAEGATWRHTSHLRVTLCE